MDIFNNIIIQELNTIWEKDTSAFSINPPIVPMEINDNSIIYLAINPSLGNSNKDEIFYPQPANDTKIHTHYRKFKEVNNRLAEQHTWSAMDLLCIKESTQNNLEPILNTDFIINQARLIMNVIKKSSPKLVVVCNSMVDRLLHMHTEKIGFSPEFDEEKCIYHSDGIPFIIRESKFLASRQHWNKNLKITDGTSRIDLLVKEMDRVLNIT